MTNENTPLGTPLVEASFDRRGLFRIGGITIASAAVMAACGNPASSAGELGRVGNGAPVPTLLDPVVDDSVLLRTSASFETSIANAYDHILETGYLTQSSATLPNLGDQSDLVTLYAEHHRLAAESFNALAQEAGGEPWTCGNPRLDSAFIDTVFTRVEDGAPAVDSTPAIPPSDDPTRDMINLVSTLELVSAATCQALMLQVTQPSYRAEAMRIGARSSREAALVALRINPGGYLPTFAVVAPTESTTTIAAAGGESAPPLTEIPLPVALPSRFGSLSPVIYIGGNGDENGVRLKLNFETPSLNSFVYTFDSCVAG
jgi:hypothetical protein